jgi:hypothetical protein
MKKKLALIVGAILVASLATVGVVLAAATPGSISTDIFVMGLQGDIAEETQVVAEYWPAAGASVADVSIARTLYGYGGYEFQADSSGLSDGWSGSAILSTDKPVAAIGELDITGGSAKDNLRIGYYNAFNEASNVLYAPFIVLDRATNSPTSDLIQYTKLTVQNTSSSDATAYFTYIDRVGGTVGPLTDTIPAFGSATYDLSQPGGATPDLTATGYWTANGFWGGGVVITSTESVLTAAVLDTWGQYSASFSAIVGGDDTIYLTNIDRRCYNAKGPNTGRWSGLTSLIVQNFDLANSVNITVTFYSKTTGNSRSFTDTLAGGQAHGYNVRIGADTPGGAAFYQELAFWDDIYQAGVNPVVGDWTDGAMLWVGSAVVEGPPGSQIAATVINQKQSENAAAMFVSASDADAAYMLSFPLGVRDRTGGDQRWNLLRVMNVGGGAVATVDMGFYNQDGTLKMSWEGQTASQYAIVDLANLKIPGTFGVLGDPWLGTIVVTSTQPVVGTSDVLWGSARYGAYNAVPLTP